MPYPQFRWLALAMREAYLFAIKVGDGRGCQFLRLS
jgi:hypothetical protein